MDVPEDEIWIDESDAVGVDTGVGADLTDDADFGFFVAVGDAKDEFLFGRELMRGDDAGAVKAEEDGLCRLRENLAIQIAADEEDGKFIRNAAAAAHNLWWQARSHREAWRGPI